MPFTPPAEYPYSDDSSPGANDGDVVYAEVVNVVMEYLEDDLPTDIAAAGGIVASNNNPANLGTTAPGVSTQLSRSDHVHDMPSAAEVGAATESFVTSAVSTHSAATDPHGDRAYTDAQIAALSSTQIYQGLINCGSNPDYPAADADDTYRVSVAGKIGGASGPDVEVGDLIVCLANATASGNHATVGSSWTIIQGNLSGVVIGPDVVTDDRIAVFSGTTGKLIEQASVTVADLATAASVTALDARIDILEAVAISAQTANYTLVLADANKVVEMDNGSARTITVPPNASVAFPTGTIVEVYQAGAGVVSIAPGAGVTIRSQGSLLDLDGQYATASLRKRATNEWVLTGELA
jgi:hypothetical protein